VADTKCEKCGGTVADGRKTCHNCGGGTTASLVARVADLELAVLSLAITEFGDRPGHPFRGNQYGGSGGAAKPAASSVTQTSHDAAPPHLVDATYKRVVAEGPPSDTSRPEKSSWKSGLADARDQAKDQPLLTDVRSARLDAESELSDTRQQLSEVDPESPLAIPLSEDEIYHMARYHLLDEIVKTATGGRG
jgi:hypothetical protein